MPLDQRIAFVTCERLPDIHGDDRLVADALHRRGFQVTHGDDRTAGSFQAAARVLSHAAGPLLYARVDGIERGAEFVLMELEINEPFLYIGSSSGAATRFADAIVRTTGSTPCGPAVCRVPTFAPRRLSGEGHVSHHVIESRR